MAHKINYQQLNLAYLNTSAKFFGVERSQAATRIRNGLKNGKYSSYIFTEPQSPDKEALCWCNARRSELYFLLEMQGVFGIPELIGCTEIKENPRQDVGTLYYETKKYSKDPPNNMDVTSMALQLFKVLQTIHESGVIHVCLGDRNIIRWHNGEIKITGWGSCTFHGDISDRCSWVDKERRQPAYDMLCAGKVIKKWMELYGSKDKELEKLVQILMDKEPSLRLSASSAIEALTTGVYNLPPIPQSFDYEALLDCYGECKLSKLVDAHSYQVLQTITPRRIEEVFKNSSGVKWKRPTTRATRHKGKIRVPRVMFGKLKGQRVCGKVRVGCPFKDPSNRLFGSSPVDLTVLIQHEFYVTQLMSGKKHFPTLLSFEMFRTKDEMGTGVVMTMPRYRRKPREKNVIRLAIELLAALETLHSYGLIHGDVAPSNVMWDEDDSLILIDFDCVQFIKRDRSYDPHHLYGQKDFVAPDYLKTFAGDVYSAGKTIEYYAKKWHQQTDELMAITTEMTNEKWFERLTVERARQMFQPTKNIRSRLMEVEILRMLG